MNWLSSNWIWLALGVGVLALMGFGRGGCGMGHGRHDHRQRDEADQSQQPRETTAALLSTSAMRMDSADAPLQPAGHVHDTPSGTQTALASEHAGHGSSAGDLPSRRHRHGC